MNRLEDYLNPHPSIQDKLDKLGVKFVERGFEPQKSLNELDQEITFQLGKQISEEIDEQITKWEGNDVSSLVQKSSEILDSEKGNFVELPDYLLNDPQIVGYPDEQFQEEIYLWVAAKMNSINYADEFSVKDLGCGRGDFTWVTRGWTIDYIGIDSNPNLIQVGQQKYPEIKLINSDFNDVSIKTDYTICIGTLNDDHGLDKWEVFNKTLIHSLNNTKTAILFVLQANCYGEEGHLDYPIHEVVQRLPEGTKFEIDNSKQEDIYLLTVHIGSFN